MILIKALWHIRRNPENFRSCTTDTNITSTFQHECLRLKHSFDSKELSISNGTWRCKNYTLHSKRTFAYHLPSRHVSKSWDIKRSRQNISTGLSWKNFYRLNTEMNLSWFEPVETFSILVRLFPKLLQNALTIDSNWSVSTNKMMVMFKIIPWLVFIKPYHFNFFKFSTVLEVNKRFFPVGWALVRLKSHERYSVLCASDRPQNRELCLDILSYLTFFQCFKCVHCRLSSQ